MMFTYYCKIIKAGHFAYLCGLSAAEMICSKLENRKPVLAQTREGKCFAESGYETGIMVNPTLIGTKDKPPGFKTTIPNEDDYKNKLKWINSYIEKWFGSEYSLSLE